MLYNTFFINFNNQNDRELDLRKKPSVLRSLRFCAASFTSGKNVNAGPFAVGALVGMKRFLQVIYGVGMIG